MTFQGARHEEGTTIAKQEDTTVEAAQEGPMPVDGGVNTECGSAGAAAPSAESETARLQLRCRVLEEENSDLKDKLLRKAADFENFRKRMFREREEAARYANTALLTDLIATIDDFERATRSAAESRDFPAFLSGIELIEKQLVEKLERAWNLKRFSSHGEPFDPNRHEAVLSAEGETDGPVVVEEYQKGYFLHERIIRPAKVKVMVPRAGAFPAREPASAEAAAEPATHKAN